VIGERKKEVQMPYDFRLTTMIPASPQQIYDAWLDNLAHSEMTGSEAIMSDELGAAISAWDGFISGRNLDLVPGERIVQSWRTTEFADEHEDSIVSVVLEEVDGGTLLTLVHANVPDEHTSYEQGGWQQYYFEPMQKYFSKTDKARRARARKAKAPSPKTRPKSAAVRTKRSAAAKKKGTAAKRASAAGRAKSEPTSAAKGKPSARRSTRGKRRR
jgi:uncharacterized protein YndB with AHSA1/START domain